MEKRVSEKQIRSMFNGDILNIVFWIVFMWVVLTAVFFGAVSPLANDSAVRMLAFVIGAIAGIFQTASLLSCIGHLKKNREQLYTEDILNLELMKQGTAREGE